MKSKILSIMLLLLSCYYSQAQEEQDQYLGADLALNMHASGKFLEKGTLDEVFLPSYNIEYKYFFGHGIVLCSHVSHVKAFQEGSPEKNVSMTPVFFNIQYQNRDAIGYVGAGTGLFFLDYSKNLGKNGLYLGYEFEFGLHFDRWEHIAINNYIRFSFVHTDQGRLYYINGGIGLMYKF